MEKKWVERGRAAVILMGAAAAKKEAAEEAAAEETAVEEAAATTLARLQRTPGTREWTAYLLAAPYEHLAFFEKMRCIPTAEYEWAVKQLLYIRTLGIAHIRGFASRTRIFQMMQSLVIKRTIWRYLDVAKPVALVVEIVTPATSESNSFFTATNMLAGKQVWITKGMSAHQAESVVLGVAAGSRVASFDVALYYRSDTQMCVEEVAADGTVGATLVAWKHYGTTLNGNWLQPKPSNYIPATIAVETTATRFKVSVRHTHSYGTSNAGVAIFRATGVAP